MSRYDWPRPTSRKKRDDPGGRGSFVARRRTDFDPIGALEAGRSPDDEFELGPVIFFQAIDRKHLWQPLGPMTVLGGQATGKPSVAGRVNALAVDPTGTRIYAASGNGGLWYSSDGGDHWRSLGGFAPTNAAEVNRPAQRNACGAVQVVFGATEADDDVYVGTGESAGQPGVLPNAQPGRSLGGIGILFAHGPAASASVDPWQREADNLIGEGVSRIAVEPGGTTVVAATTIGLFQRPSPAVADADWTRVAGEPFSTLTNRCSDVLWTAGTATRPARLWVWVRTGDKAGLWVRPQGTANFKKVATPDAPNRRAVLAASLPPDQVFLLVDRGASAPPLLYRIAAATHADPAAAQVAGVPNVLKDQGFYDIALTVHPAHPNRIVLGGCVFDATTPDGTVVRGDGAVVVGDVADKAGTLTFGHPNPYTMIGVGVHADVHDIAYSNNGSRIWVSCDGGVYRSDHPAKQVGFYTRNEGLAIIESNYVANHPTCEGYVVTGLQDNGVIERISNGVWHRVEGGDGGSVVFDPKLPERFLSQYVRGIYRASDGSFSWNSPDNLLNRAGALAGAENDASAFYSNAAGTEQTRGAKTVGQIIAGSTRVWYTENFGAPWPTATGPRWVTLPTGTDPLPGDRHREQDDFGQAITVCRWQSPDVAWVLGEGKLMRYARVPGSDNGGGPGTWSRETILQRSVSETGGKTKKNEPSPEAPIRDSRVWTDIAVDLDPPPGPNQPPAQHGTKGAVYLGTIGKPGDKNVDTLWWFDGTSKWFKTGLRTDPNGVPAPVTAIVCDPVVTHEVYVGTTIGVWKGVRVQIGDVDPVWTWHKRLNGLPEAAVEDLAIFYDSKSGLRLLRAAIASRGVWELRLDVADVADLTYVRAHDDDLRYREQAVETQRDLVTARSWHSSPDVRPRRPSTARAAPASLPWTESTFTDNNAEALRRFQAALRSQSGDPRVRPTGRWDTYFNEVLRDLGAPTLPAPEPPHTVGITKAFWEATMVPSHATAEPWGAGTPTEAEILDLTAELKEGEATQTSCALPAQALKVDVLVHRRGFKPVDGAKVHVTLLWWADTKKKHAAKWNDATTWFSGNVAWTPAVNEVLNSDDGKTAKALGAGWHFVRGNSTQSHRISLAGQTIDATHSGVATFELDLSSRKKHSVVLVVAIIHDETPPDETSPAKDLALVPATLKDLALKFPNVAVRSIKISS